MIDVIEKTNDLIDELDNTDFVINMKKLKKEIINNNLINTNDVKELYKNEIIHKYIENQNILDLHIYYLNSKIKEITNNKVHNESN